MDPEQQMAAVAAAERNIYRVVKEHPRHCRCDVCGLWRHIYAVWHTMRQPGWEVKPAVQSRP